MDERDEDGNEEEVEDDEPLLPLMWEAPDLERAAWGKREDGRPVKNEAVVTGVAVEGCVGDVDDAPIDFRWLSAPLACVLLS